MRQISARWPVMIKVNIIRLSYAITTGFKEAHDGTI